MIKKYIKKLNFKIKEIIIMTTLIMLESILLMIDPIILGKIIDSITSRSTDFYTYIIYLLFIYVFSIILYKIRSNYLIKITAKVEKKIKIDIFSHILKIKYKSYLKIDKGKLLNSIENDSMVISNLLSQLIDFFRCIISIVVILILMLRISKSLSIISISFIPIEFIFFLISGNLLRKKIFNLSISKDKYINLINETIDGLKTLKIFMVLKERLNIFNNETESIYDLGINKSKFEVNMGILVNMLTSISRFIILFIGAIYCIKGSISVGSLVAFTTYAEKFKSETSNLTNLNSLIQSIGVSIERIEKIYNDVEIYDFINDDKGLKDINELKVNGLTFSYVDGNEIINNFSYEFKKGNIYKIEGDSGKGKSTIFDILAGFYPSKLIKHVEINGVNLYTKDISTYENSVLYIDQFSYMFTETIYENISLYRNIDLSVIKRICKELNLNDLIESLPDKYNTIINKDTNLSGGQMQRILIARALVEKKPMYIFDEVTRSLDIGNKEKFLRVLEKLGEDSIVIYASHDEYKLQNYDIKYIEI
ncbi:ABC transporter transmembrane domain-containing protein [Peptostreptococcus faecalis]|uniref:ABC transporter transmembrane domain-containing protein n=1 Tax=Peptostreptococcus faecalis TaxID=2045015 RepID=UPI0015E11FCD|nr:ABC transporter ATP-binding protein [Peptostreptococcus faecalis]